MRNAATAHHAQRIQCALDHLESSLQGACASGSAAAAAQMSPWHFQRVFRRVVGVAPQQYLRRRRLSLAANELLRSSRSVCGIALDWGFESHEVFTRAFQVQFGMAPAAFRKRGVAPTLAQLQLPLHTTPREADGETEQLEVMHWLADGSEARAMAQLRETMRQRGFRWRDATVPGGGGRNAMELLRARGVGGHLPSAAQLTAPNLREWARSGALLALDDIAQAGNWESLLPGPVTDLIRHDGHYVAAPLNVHRLNTLWINLRIFRSLGLAPPRSWASLISAARRLRAAGIVPLALSEQPWQLSVLFEGIVLSLGGAQHYRRAFVQRDPSAMASETTARSLALFASLAPFAPAAPGSHGAAPDWIDATRLVTEGRAAMQFTGDWAKGEFEVAGLRAEHDYTCVPVPGTDGVFAFSIDTLAMFAQDARHGAAVQRAQRALIHAAMEAPMQQRFNRSKGSIPARSDVGVRGFDVYARLGMRSFVGSQADGSLVPAWGAALPLPLKTQLEDVLLQAWRGQIETAAAVDALVRAVRGADSR